MNAYFKPVSYFYMFLFAGIILSTFLVGCSGGNTVSDIDGNEYKIVQIGTQWWMAENLQTTKYRNGISIPNVEDGEEWISLSTHAYSVYDNDPNNIDPYGLLYNWYAVNNENGICPEGWHVPTDEEWMELEMFLGMSESDSRNMFWRGSTEGGQLKAKGTRFWLSPNTEATNESGFSALPGGGRTGSSRYSGGFFYKGSLASIWSSTEQGDLTAWFRDIGFARGKISRNAITKRNGFSVRCVMD